MAFTRAFLKSTGLTDEQIAAVIEEHTSVTDSLKADRDKYRTEAEKIPGLQTQLDELKSGENFRQKYEDEHKAFEDFKKKTAADAESARVRAAYRKLLVDEGISEKRLDLVMKFTDFTGIKIDKDGKLEGEGELRKAIAKDFGEFKTTVTTQGAKVETPPQSGSGKMSRDEILKISDTSARQKAIAENLDLFQKG